MEKSRYSKINNFCLIFLTGFAMTATLIFTKPALVPLVFAFFLYGIVSSVIRVTADKLRIKKSVATLLVTVFFMFLLYETGNIILISATEVVESAALYQSELANLLQSINDHIPHSFYGFDMAQVIGQLHHMPYFTYARNITGVLFKIAGNFLLILVFLYFFMLSERKSELTNPLLRNILEKVGAYVSIKFFMSLLTGLLLGSLFLFFDIKMYLALGFISFLLNFIPSVGATIATILPLPLLFFQYGFGWQFFVVLAAMIAVHIFIGYIFEPKIMGENLDLHPVTILVFLIFWGLVWGVPGLFLAVPITSILKIVLSRLENTWAFSELLSGRLPR